MCRGEGKAQLSVPILLAVGPQVGGPSPLLTTTERQGGLREVISVAGGGDRSPDTTQCNLSPGPAAFALACPVLAHLGHCSGLTIALPETPPLVLPISIPRHPPHTPRCSAASSTSLGVGARAAMCLGTRWLPPTEAAGCPLSLPNSLNSKFWDCRRHAQHQCRSPRCLPRSCGTVCLPALAKPEANIGSCVLCSIMRDGSGAPRSREQDGPGGCCPQGGSAEREPGRRTWRPAPIPLRTVTPGGAALGNHRLPSGPPHGGVGRGHQEPAHDPTGDDSRTPSWDVSWEHKEMGKLLCWGWPRSLGAGLEPPDLLSEGRRQLPGGPSASGEPHVFTDQTGRLWRQHFAPAEPDARDPGPEDAARGFPGLHCAGEDAEAYVL
ncbi:unnamed protein product [Nyctereutes procyonoides]|uniref:(raccoon dog) hypothetical protein n=1 Tax=Nyctereutes procyonoides TaxID=34880 RepID=A0A812A028_NYCPR|nr:unnamed protein product [Nyctereutes procyonoides]